MEQQIEQNSATFSMPKIGDKAPAFKAVTTYYKQCEVKKTQKC